MLQLYLKLDKSSRKREWVGGWGGVRGLCICPCPTTILTFHLQNNPPPPPPPHQKQPKTIFFKKTHISPLPSFSMIMSWSSFFSLAKPGILQHDKAHTHTYHMQVIHRTSSVPLFAEPEQIHVHYHPAAYAQKPQGKVADLRTQPACHLCY